MRVRGREGGAARDKGRCGSLQDNSHGKGRCNFLGIVLFFLVVRFWPSPLRMKICGTHQKWKLERRVSDLAYILRFAIFGLFRPRARLV